MLSVVVVGQHSDGCLCWWSNVSNRGKRGHTRLTVTTCWQENATDVVRVQVTQKKETSRELGAAGVRGWGGHADVQTQVGWSAATVTECFISRRYSWYIHTTVRYKVTYPIVSALFSVIIYLLAELCYESSLCFLLVHSYQQAVLTVFEQRREVYLHSVE